MYLRALTTEQVNLYKKAGLVHYDLDPFLPEYSLENSTRASVPYCIQAESRWQNVRADHISTQNMQVIHFFDPTTSDDKRMDLLSQPSAGLEVRYKAFQERNGLTVFPDGKLMLVTPPVLGVAPHNIPVIIKWPRDASVEEMNSICEMIREEMKLPLFALTVRVLHTSLTKIPALVY